MQLSNPVFRATVAALPALDDQELSGLAVGIAAELERRNLAPVGPFADLVRSMRTAQKSFYKSSGISRDRALVDSKNLERRVDAALGGPPAVDPQASMVL